MELNKLTQIELLELRKKCNEALEEYSKRDKIKVYKLSVFGNDYYYSNFKTVLEEYNSYIEDFDFGEMLAENPISMSVEYFNEAEFEKWVNKY